MTNVGVRERRNLVDVVARVLTEAGAPWVVNIVSSMVIGIAVGAPGWGAFVAVCAGVVPMAIILAGIRRAKIGDHHVTKIDERHLLIVALLVVVVAGLVVLIAAHAPIEMIAFMSAGLAALTVAGVVTSIFHWKVSVHTGVSAGVAVVLALAVSPWWLPALVLTPLIGWSRIHLGDHTRGQVVVGALTGALTAGVTYALIA
ncbi:phosphatase PAP2 family protein [Prescottella agglutinans]|uniref:Phosphatase PAP2 family protein n=1 Tax=Prescottella agglutinans TaxID=1644129 RepID=A0A438BAZ8_9NOCA|nr:phosphatase PAP2 family protein [Prescottella agglutinans]RVW07895.1 phosphatase PAP2 family protein [Prescottella agglutinans]